MKRALIVDDSRLARHVLSKMLTQHGVAADAAESAEAALEYLKGHRPDVIFLDHLMPGMDGFEALEAIKANPVTATIPVMMYTSKEGELYVGQARALGALGVLPKNVQPVEVTKVLRTLHLIPGGGELEAARSMPPAPGPAPLDARQLRELLADLFYEQHTAWRDELRREIARLAATLPAPPPAPALPAAAAAEQRPQHRAPSRGYQAATAALLVAVAVFAYLFYRTGALLSESHERTRELAAVAAQLSAVSTRTLAVAETPGAGPGVLPVLEWGFNSGGRFEFGEVALDGSRANVLGGLLEELRRINFAGTVALDVHVGRFCMNYGANGDLELAAPAQAVATCDQLGWPELEAVAIGQQQSLDFAYVLATAAKENRALRLETLSHGSAEPIVPYPASNYDLTAGEWNALAARNQRVEIRLVSD
jgi:CheY-like chemotaxis protein